jgi:L-ascorbate metabolism protein UlaG (beta-lactamase superfamily)
VKLTYIGGPTLRIELGGVTLVTDPSFDAAGTEYTTGPVTLSKTADPALPATSLGAIDAVLLSHDHHADNLDHAGRDFLSHAGKVLTTQAGAERLGGNAVGLAPWEEVGVKGMKVVATPARHGPANGDRGPVIGFMLQDTVYISGDTVWFEGVEETIRRFPAIRTAILFLGAAHVPVVPSHLTFTAEEAVRFARAVPEAVIVPAHFEGWKHFTESRQQIQKTFSAAGIEDRLRWLVPGIAAEV